LAERVALTLVQIQGFEQGSERIPAAALFAIGSVLEMSPAYFFEGLARAELDSPAPGIPRGVASKSDVATLLVALSKIEDPRAIDVTKVTPLSANDTGET
jgi:transcriptional regulator with XRE-family HTH domain